MAEFSDEQLAFITKHYFAYGKSIIAAQRAYRRHYNILVSDSVPSRKVILQCVENYRKTGNMLLQVMKNIKIRMKECEARKGGHLQDIIFRK